MAINLAALQLLHIFDQAGKQADGRSHKDKNVD
jgi:hypothetical protein